MELLPSFFLLGVLALPTLFVWLLVVAPRGVLEVRQQQAEQRKQVQHPNRWHLAEQETHEKLHRTGSTDDAAEAFLTRWEREDREAEAEQQSEAEPQQRDERKPTTLRWVLVAGAFLVAWYFDAFSAFNPYTYRAEVGYYDNRQPTWFVGADKSYDDCMSEAIARFNAINAAHTNRTFAWSCRKMQGERFIERVR